MDSVEKKPRKRRSFKPDLTAYSAAIPGDRRNYNWIARFDFTTGGYVGINQDQDAGLQRVLLSPKQVTALVEFCASKKRHPPRSVR